MIELHYYPGNASSIVHLLLEEMGLPFRLVLVDRSQNAHHSAEYIKLNPNGLIPVLTDGDLVLYETAAICLYLADQFPEKRMSPPMGSIERAHFYKWLIWLTNTLQSALIMYFYPERYVAQGNATGAAEVKAMAQTRIGGMLAQIDEELGRRAMQYASPGWFAGAEFGLLDAYLFVLCRWTRGFTERPARSFEYLGPYLQRVLARPAAQRMFATEKIQSPYV